MLRRSSVFWEHAAVSFNGITCSFVGCHVHCAQRAPATPAPPKVAITFALLYIPPNFPRSSLLSFLPSLSNPNCTAPHVHALTSCNESFCPADSSHYFFGLSFLLLPSLLSVPCLLWLHRSPSPPVLSKSFAYRVGRPHNMTPLKVLLSLCLLVLVATTCFAQVADEAEMNPNPVLFVSKTTSSDDVILGSSVEVIVTITNRGQSPAFDINVTDQLEEGVKTLFIASLPYGASETLRYTITPSALGNYPISVARVSYNTEQGNAATAHTALSNFIREGEAYYYGEGVDDESFRGVLSVLTRDRYERLHARYIKESTAYIFLGAIPALFPYVLYRVKQSEVDALLRRTKGSK